MLTGLLNIYPFDFLFKNTNTLNDAKKLYLLDMEMDLQFYRKIKIAIEIYSHYHIQTLKSNNGTIWRKNTQIFSITKKTFHLSHSKSNFM